MFSDTSNKENKFFNIKYAGGRTLLFTGFILIVLSIGGSYFFSLTIQRFFWEARTKSVAPIVQEAFEFHTEETDISRWNETESQERIKNAKEEILHSLPNVVAIKIFTINGVLADTNLNNIKPGYLEEGMESELLGVENNIDLVKPASEETKIELGKTELLEVWTSVKNSNKNSIGYVELYFDSSDIGDFITRIQYTIGGSLIFVLVIIILLIRIAFRKQDALIIHQKEELASIIEQSPIGIYTIDKNGVIETYNPAMMKISGITDANETIGKNVFDAEAYKKNGLDKLFHEAMDGASFETEVEVESSLGLHKKTFRHYHCVPVRDEGGLVDYLLIMVEDITERKALEEKVAEYTKGLEGKMNERTKELQNKIDELERFERLTVDRELRMIELKQKIEKMRVKLESFGVKSETI